MPHEDDYRKFAKERLASKTVDFDGRPTVQLTHGGAWVMSWHKIDSQDVMSTDWYKEGVGR